MWKRIAILPVLTLCSSLTTMAASDREADVKRTRRAAEVFQQVVNDPDRGIPRDLLNSAKCIAVIPGEIKFAFVFGGNYGRGLAICRTRYGWSAPMFVAVDGGQSFTYC